MTFESTKSLSASLEDYLQAIFWTAAATGAARAKDIARQLGVKASSVTGALQTLAEKRFVHYQPYEAITLTAEGFDEAARVAQRHFIVREFFVTVLGLDRAVAEEEACRTEHCLGDDIAERLATLMEFVKAHPDMESGVSQLLAERYRSAEIPAQVRRGPVTVADLRSGQKAVIVAVRSGGALARRLVDMGLGRGALVEVEGAAPTGDPIRVKIRGYQLALRRTEAAAISVVGK
ncbi:MAG: metal-dependent transcriptional regulator [Planctomycetota bacterium]|nr:metal-dependent transcriptional regulator [Planctomycetota bacterium]